MFRRERNLLLAVDDEADTSGSTLIADTVVILDPDLDLPPIIKPRPGIRETDDDT